jgi:hypothetical protein
MSAPRANALVSNSAGADQWTLAQFPMVCIPACFSDGTTETALINLLYSDDVNDGV